MAGLRLMTEMAQLGHGLKHSGMLLELELEVL